MEPFAVLVLLINIQAGQECRTVIV